MGKRGPRPMPTRVLQQRGSWRAKLNRNEPVPPPGAPRCPAWLSPGAKAMWRSLVPLLEAARLLTKVDRNALTRYCVLWDRWKKAELFIAQYGSSYPIKDDQGRVKCFAQFPEVAIAAKLAGLLGRLEQELGLTPSARSRIELAPAATAEELERREMTKRFILGQPPLATLPRAGG